MFHIHVKAAVITCQRLKEKMSEVREKMKDPSWLELVRKCHMSGVDLSAHHMSVVMRKYLAQTFKIISGVTPSSTSCRATQCGRVW